MASILGSRGLPFPDEFPSLFVQIYIKHIQRKYDFHFGFKGGPFPRRVPFLICSNLHYKHTKEIRLPFWVQGGSLSQASSLPYLFKFTS